MGSLPIEMNADHRAILGRLLEDRAHILALPDLAAHPAIPGSRYRASRKFVTAHLREGGPVRPEGFGPLAGPSQKKPHFH